MTFFKPADNTDLARKSIAGGIHSVVFRQYRENPEHFFAEATFLIRERNPGIIIERLTYDEVADRHDIEIFITGQSTQDFSMAGEKLRNHLCDYVVTDSQIEKDFCASNVHGVFFGLTWIRSSIML